MAAKAKYKGRTAPIAIQTYIQEPPSQEFNLMVESILDGGDELNDCLKVILMKHQKMTGKDIAAAFGYQLETMYAKITGWRNDGTWDKAYRIFFQPIAMSMATAIAEIARDAPMMLQEAMTIAHTAPDMEVRIEAMKWLFKDFINPALQMAHQEPDRKPIQLQKDFSPTTFALPPGEKQDAVQPLVPQQRPQPVPAQD